MGSSATDERRLILERELEKTQADLASVTGSDQVPSPPQAAQRRTRLMADVAALKAELARLR